MKRRVSCVVIAIYRLFVVPGIAEDAAAAVLGFVPPFDGIERFVNPNDTCTTAQVGGNPEYDTIQQAVDASSPGDVVAVCPGTYEEVVNVPVARLIIVADGHVVIRPPTTGPNEPAFDVVADEVTIRGFEITGFGGAIWLTADTASVQNNRILDVQQGVMAEGAGHRIRNNVIRIGSGGESGIRAFGVEALTISGNRVSGGNVAIAIQSSAGADIHHNALSGVWLGVEIDDGAGDVVRNNTIRDSAAGIGLVGCDGAVVRQNLVQRSEQFGIVVVDTTGCAVGFNAVSFNDDLGIDLRGIEGCRIERNVVTRSTGTACVWDGLGTNVFSRNSCVTETPPGAWD